MKKNKIILTIIFIIYIAISLYLMMTHEIWADEAQAWQIAKTLSIPEIINQMQYEAHPCLWHLILAIPAKLGLPAITMNIISWIIVSLAVYIILYHSKFNVVVKILIILNPTFIYYTSAISRSYCLIILLLTLFAYIYPKRQEHSLVYVNILGILAHTHMIICGFVGITALIFLFENRKNKKCFFSCLGILFIYFIILVAILLPALKNCIFVPKEASSTEILISAFSKNNNEMAAFFFPKLLETKYAILLIAVLVVAITFTFINDLKRGIIYLISLIVFYIIQLNWPFVIFERTCLIFALFIFLNFNNKNKSFQIFLCFLSISIIISNIDEITHDATKDFSDSKKVATFINQNIPNNSLIYVLQADRYTSMIPYIEKDLDYYNVPSQKFQTYNTWNYQSFAPINEKKVYEQLENFSYKYENIYIILADTSFINKSPIKEIIETLQKEKHIFTYYHTNISYGSQEFFTIYKYSK